MEITPLGDSALIIRVRDESVSDESAVLETLRRLEAAAIPGVIEFAPAFTSVAVFFDPVRVHAAGAPAEVVSDWLQTRITSVLEQTSHLQPAGLEPRLVEIPVCYDADFALDLQEVTRHRGLSPEEVVSRHAAASYRVQCIGFAPGFPYLSGLPPELAVPRRATPRKEVAAGSVGIGGAQTGIYPQRSPGGWNLIGRTPLRLFNPRQNPPALLRAGDRVRFRPITRDEFERLSK